MIIPQYATKIDEVVEDIADTAEHIPSTAPATAGVRYYVTAILVANLHAATATRVNIVDGTGGTIIASAPAAANGGGAIIVFPKDDPLIFTKGNAVVVQCETNATLTTVTIKGYKRTERD